MKGIGKLLCYLMTILGWHRHEICLIQNLGSEFEKGKVESFRQDKIQSIYLENKVFIDISTGLSSSGAGRALAEVWRNLYLSQKPQGIYLQLDEIGILASLKRGRLHAMGNHKLSQKETLWDLCLFSVIFISIHRMRFVTYWMLLSNGASSKF